MSLLFYNLITTKIFTTKKGGEQIKIGENRREGKFSHGG
jgi:hypothetical protein